MMCKVAVNHDRAQVLRHTTASWAAEGYAQCIEQLLHGAKWSQKPYGCFVDKLGTEWQLARHISSCNSAIESIMLVK